MGGQIDHWPVCNITVRMKFTLLSHAWAVLLVQQYRGQFNPGRGQGGLVLPLLY